MLSANLMANASTLFNFSSNATLNNWTIVNDGVMGGISVANISLDDEGNAVFAGQVSLENNGGFSSVRYRFQEKNISQFSKIAITLKGDGKRYQFRVKSNKNDRHTYIQYFQINGDWQTIEIDLKNMTPTFRGQTLKMPNFDALKMEEIAFLIANGKAENFKLVIDKIELK